MQNVLPPGSRRQGAPGRDNLLRRGGLFALLFFLLAQFPVDAQRRPLLRNTSRDLFAGRFLAIPRDGRPFSYQQPKMLAEIADHDLLTPPFRALGVPAESLAWAKSFDLSIPDGAIFSMEAIAVEPDFPRTIRQRRPGMPIYAYFTGAPNEALLRQALDLVAAGALDYLLLAGAGEAGPAAIGLAAERGLQGRVAFDDGAEAAMQLLVARMINRRFGFSPRFAPIHSSAPAETNRRLAARVAVINGADLPRPGDTGATIDGFLFLHQPQTTAAQRQSFVETLVQALDKGARAALVDLAAGPDREALIAELRRRKLLDKLFAYAAADPAAASSEAAAGDAIARALTQVATLSTALRFLRDDLPRLRRLDRAQFTLLFNRYLTDWGYALRVRPGLEAFVRAELQASPEDLGAAADRAAAFVFERIRPFAEEIFNEQFRRNLHALLMSNGERVIFEMGLLQRLHVRFAAPRVADLEILQSVHVPQITFPQPPAAELRPEWTLMTENLEQRVFNRVEAVNWEIYKSDAESVDLNIVFKPRELPPEGYRIVSTRRRKNRRIDITASTEQGAYYAVSRLEELAADGRLAEDLQLIEAPALPRRGILDRLDGASWSHADRLEMIRFLGRVRMNRYYYAPKDDPFCGARWREEYSDVELQRIGQLAQTANRHFVELVYGLDLAAPGAAISYSAEADWQALTRRLDSLASIGVRHFLLFLPVSPEPQAAGRFVARVHGHLAARGRGFELAVASTGAVAGFPPDVLLFGGESQPGRPAIHRDAWPGNERKSWRLFLGPKRGAFADLPPDAAGYVAAPMAPPRASMLPLATAAEFAWDGKSYNPANALNTALDLLYDERARARVRVWEQVYGDAPQDANLFDSLHEAPTGEIPLPLIEQRLAELQNALDAINATREQGLLRGELAAVLERHRIAVERMKNDAAYERLSNGNYQLRK